MSELKHYGILGMKWGVRRYQNKDGSLTPRGKKKVAEEYKKESIKSMNDLGRQYQSMYVDSHNRVADQMNNGGIDRFNRKQEKKYGKGYARRLGYDDDFEKECDKMMAKELNRSLYEFYKTNPHAIKARSLVKEYEMTKWNDLAKENEEKIENIRRIFEH